MDIGLQPESWHDFFLATATAAAALLGLIFVAISLHVDVVEGHPVLRNRARINLQALAILLAVCLCALIPRQSNQLLGAEFVAGIAVYWTLGVMGVVSMRRSLGGLPRRLLLRIIGQNSVSVLTVAAGVSLMIGHGPGLILEAPVLIVGLPVTTWNAWNVIYGPELRDAKREKSQTRD